MIEQESLISVFPFVPEDGSFHGRRSDRSTFVRAHVMERYHRERRARKATKGIRIDKPNHHFVTPTRKLQWQEVEGIDNSPGKKSKSPGPHLSPIPKSAKGENGSVSPPAPIDIGLQVSDQEDKSQDELEEVESLYSPPLHDPVKDNSSHFIRIISSYSKVLDSRSTGLDVMNKVWLPAAFSDPALFHASFSNYSTHLKALYQEQDVPASLEHKGIALQQISKTIKSTDAPTDQMIATVLCLAGSELLNEDPAALTAHMKGIREMIAARGGSELLGFNGVLQRLYLTYELLFSTVFKNQRPPPIEGFQEHCSSNYQPRSTEYGIFTLSKTLLDATLHGFSYETVLLLSALCHHLSASNTLATDLADLLSSFDSPTSPNSSNQDHILQSLLLATSIQFPPTNPGFTPLSLPYQITQLQWHLNRTPLRNWWHPLPGALLWCIVVGAMASQGLPERYWFIANLVRMVTGLAFENWEGLRNSLETFAGVVSRG